MGNVTVIRRKKETGESESLVIPDDLPIQSQPKFEKTGGCITGIKNPYDFDNSILPIPDRFTGTPTFHFIVHIYPVKDYWKSHVDKWNHIAELINGVCVARIVIDKNTQPISEVRNFLSDKFQIVTGRNVNSGENPTFQYALKEFPKGDNDIMIYCHSKGAKKSTAESQAVQKWIDLMYETVCFNQAEIVRRFDQGFKAFGSFRAFSKYPLRPQYKWHYAGTFFAVRLKHCQESMEIKKGYGGVEAWPGHHFPPEESWVEFADNCHITAQYRDSVMLGSEMTSKYEQWKLNQQCSFSTLIAITTCRLDQTKLGFIEDFKRTIQSVRKYTSNDVLIVDDGSDSDYQQFLKIECTGINETLILNQKNSGVATAKNQCLDYFENHPEYDFLIMLDDDIEIISKQFVSYYVTPVSDGVSPVISFNDPSYTGSRSEDHSEKTVKSSHTCGVCIVLGRASLQYRLKVLPGKWGCAHTEFCERVSRKKSEFIDVKDSQNLIRLAGHNSVFSFAEKKRHEKVNLETLKKEMKSC